MVKLILVNVLCALNLLIENYEGVVRSGDCRTSYIDSIHNSTLGHWNAPVVQEYTNLIQIGLHGFKTVQEHD